MGSIADRRRQVAFAARARLRNALAASAANHARHAAAQAELARPPKGSALHRLHNQLTRQQHEAGCRFRHD